jgi:hypothetical protein
MKIKIFPLNSISSNISPTSLRDTKEHPRLSLISFESLYVFLGIPLFFSRPFHAFDLFRGDEAFRPSS